MICVPSSAHESCTCCQSANSRNVPSMRRSFNEDLTSASEKWALIVNCVRHRSRMFSQSIATSQQSRNGQIVSTWPNRLHTSHSACGQCFSEWPISSHVLHWWYGQSDALLVSCLLELQAEHSLSGQLASSCPCCSHKLQSSASGQFCSECPISSHVLH